METQLRWSCKFLYFTCKVFIPFSSTMDVESLFFMGLQLYFRLRGENRTPTPGRNVWHTDCVLKDDLTENVDSSNKRCTIEYKQNFDRKLNWANKSLIDYYNETS